MLPLFIPNGTFWVYNESCLLYLVDIGLSSGLLSSIPQLHVYLHGHTPYLLPGHAPYIQGKTSLPVLGNVEAPLELEMLLLVVVDKGRDGVVVAPEEHSGGGLLLGD